MFRALSRRSRRARATKDAGAHRHARSLLAEGQNDLRLPQVTMPVQPIFDQVAAALYQSEVHDLTDACLYQLTQLEKASRKWLKLKEITTRHTVRTRAGMRDRKSQDGYHAAMQAMGRVQSALFDGVEAFLAAWARLSLIFRPGRSRSPFRAFTAHRGATMCRLYGLEAGHLLLDRAARDNWMHSAALRPEITRV